MGRSYTPKYVVQIFENGATSTPMAWKKEYGLPTEDNLRKFVFDYVDSLKLGGANEHISKSLGYTPCPYAAEIRCNDSSRKVLASWKAGMFQVY